MIDAVHLKTYLSKGRLSIPSSRLRSLVLVTVCNKLFCMIYSAMQIFNVARPTLSPNPILRRNNIRIRYLCLKSPHILNDPVYHQEDRPSPEFTGSAGSKLSPQILIQCLCAFLSTLVRRIRRMPCTDTFVKTFLSGALFDQQARYLFVLYLQMGL